MRFPEMMKYAKLCIVPVLVIVSFNCGSNALTEKEPNDDFATATAVDVDKIVKGCLATASDVDYYVIDIAEPLRFEISLTAVKGVNHSIEIYNGKREFLKSVDDNRKSSPEKISNIWFDKGRYFICITHGDRDERKGNEESPYYLCVKLVEQDLSHEKEPNDSMTSANTIEVDKPVTGYYSPSMNKSNPDQRFINREVDWYTFEIPESDENTRTYDVELSGVKGITAEVSIYNAENLAVLSAESGEKGQPVYFRSHSFKKGGYFICIAAKNFESNPSEKYTITLKSQVTDSTRESEPNNTIADANTIEGDNIKGTLFSDADHDFYAISTDGRKIMRFELRFEDRVMALIRIYDEKDNVLSECKGKDSVFRIPSVAIKGKTFVEITCNGKNKSEKAYELNISKSSFSNNDEEEPNNDIKHSQLITGNEIKGYINYKKDKDYYRIEIPERMKKRIVVTGMKSAILNISVTDSEGYIIQSRKVRNDETVRIEETIDKTGYIIVESLKENQMDPYTLRVEE